MGKGGEQTTTQSQSSTTQPWAEAIPLLRNLIGQYGGQSTAVTPEQTAATGTISDEANAIPGYGGDINATLAKMFGSDTTPQVGMLNTAYGNLQNSLNPIADPNNLNPYNTPGFSDAISRMTGDITKGVKGIYAGAGRDPSGAGSFAGSLGRGLTEGIAPVIANQYNQNVGNLRGAAGELAAGGMNTAGAITGQQQVPLSNMASAIGMIPSAVSGQMAPGMARYGAANLRYGMPYQNLQALLGPAAMLGSMGQQSQETGTSTTQGSNSMFGNIMGGLMGGTGILSKMGAFGPTGWLLASDERVKDDIEPIGKLYDDQTVFRYRYKGDPTMRIGLLAQEVAEHEPDAVGEIPHMGILAVEHGRATDRAAELGRAV